MTEILVQAPTPCRQPRSTFDVIIIGAGVAGICSAYALARRGLSVAIVDRNTAPARGTSFANGAQLSYSYTDALASATLLRELPQLLLSRTSLLKVHIAPDLDLLRWQLRFLGACRTSTYVETTRQNLTLAIESRLALHELLNCHPISFDYHRDGKMVVYYDEQGFARAQRAAELKRSMGIDLRALSLSDACDVEPALGHASGVVGALFSPDDETGDPRLFCEGLLKVLIEEYGVEARFGVKASVAFTGDAARVHLSNGETLNGAIALAAVGASDGHLLRDLGYGALVQPIKGYSFTAPMGDRAPRLSITDTRRRLVFCPLNGQLRVAGAADVGNGNLDIEDKVLRRLQNAARESLPDAADYDRASEPWCGLRPATPNSRPIIARVQPRMIVNIGYGAYGWTLSTGAAERAAELTMTALAELKERSLH